MASANSGLDAAWRRRCSYYDEGNKLWAKSFELRAKDYEQEDKLSVEGYRLWAEGDKLIAEGNILWFEVVLAVYGNIEMEWKNWNPTHRSYECHLSTGEVFGF